MTVASAFHASTATSTPPVSLTRENRFAAPRATGLQDEHANWLESTRKIPVEVAVSAGVTSHGSNLAFEYRDQGKQLYRKVRLEVVDQATGSAKKTFFAEPSGVPPILWNVDCLDETPADMPMIITEGEFDALAALTAGMNAVSVPNGAMLREPGKGDIDPNNDQAFAFIWSAVERLQKFERVILATDNDQPGRVLRGELAIRLGRDRCWFVEYPDGCKDLNDVLMRHGADALTDVIAAARPIVPSKLCSFSDIPDLEQSIKYRSGWPGLDLTFLPGTLTIVTGPPNHGKSSWMLGLAANFAFDAGLKGAILQFEDQPKRNRDDLVRYYRSRVGGTEGEGFSNVPREEALAWIDRMFLTISPFEDANDVSFDLSWLESVIREAATRHNCKWLVIDPWNEVEHIFGRGMREDQYITTALMTLKKAARRYQLMLFIVAHPTNTGMKKETVEEMTLSDVNGGGVWRAKADIGVIVYMPDKSSSKRHIKIDKTKNWVLMGRPDTVTMSYKPGWGVWHCDGKGAL